MSHAIRNSIILFVFLIALIGFYYYQVSGLNKQIETIERQIESSRTELRRLQATGIRPDTLRIHYLMEKGNQMESWVLQNSKFFLADDNSNITWPYLQSIIRRFNPNFLFNFTVSNRGQGQFEYVLTGTSTLNDLYSFINHIERLGALYTIENLIFNPQLRETDTGPTNFINYSITIRSWVDRSVGQRINEVGLRRIAFTPILRDPFRARIHPPLRVPSQELLPDSRGLNLVSYTRNQAFFIDKDGHVITLRPMERVAYGYFSHIDQRNNRAVFRINRTGLYESIYQYLN